MSPWQAFTGSVESVHDYHGVLVPLEEAYAYSHSVKRGKKSGSFKPSDSGEEYELNGSRIDDDDNETQGMLKVEKNGEYTIEGLRKEMRQGQQGSLTPYEIKSKLINKAIQDIGMGSYNWQLFVLCGFGWFADNLWLQGASLTLPSLSAEFDLSETRVRYTTSALFVGLSLGSFIWGIGSDYLGRRIPFNICLLIAGVFGVLAAFQQTWGAVCFYYSALGFGVGGSLPVDGALFLEFLPNASGSLLTLLSVWWPVGQFVSSLIAWFFIAKWPVDQGWRYFLVTIGVVTLAMFIIRFFIFHLFESPKYLLNRGRQDEAVAVVHGIAYRNKTRTWLTSEILDQVAYVDDEISEDQGCVQQQQGPRLSPLASKLRSLSGEKLRGLFKTKQLGIATVLMWFVWATIGMGYPLFNAFLPQYFAKHSGTPDGGEMQQSETTPISSETYQNYAITSIFGIPGSLLAAYLVDRSSPFFGRRGTLAISTLVSAIFLFFFVIWGSTSLLQLTFSCVGSFAQNIMYGVLYAFTPEIFPAPVRGAGTGVASFLNRITGLLAPVLAANMPGDTPIYVSAVLIFMAFFGICGVPIETRGTERL